MSRKPLREVVAAAVKGERGDGGWIKVSATRESEKDISLAVMEAHEKGLVKGCDVSDMSSEYPE